MQFGGHANPKDNQNAEYKTRHDKTFYQMS